MKNSIIITLAVTVVAITVFTSCSKEKDTPTPTEEVTTNNPTPVSNYNITGITLTYDYKVYMDVQFATDNCISLEIQPGDSFTTCTNGTGTANGEWFTNNSTITFHTDTSYSDANQSGQHKYYKVIGNKIMTSDNIIGQQSWINASNASYGEFGEVVVTTSTHIIMNKFDGNPNIGGAGVDFLYGFTK